MMTMTELREKAERMGVKAGKMRKTDLVHAIQEAEGFTPCYGIPNGFCHEMECCFRDDCCCTAMLLTPVMSNKNTCKALASVT